MITRKPDSCFNLSHDSDSTIRNNHDYAREQLQNCHWMGPIMGGGKGAISAEAVTGTLKDGLSGELPQSVALHGDSGSHG
jgi:hypothetical protein